MSLAPQLKKRRIDLAKLLLDPNNPRLFATEESRVPDENVADPGVQAETRSKLFPPNGKDQFKIEELVKSILRNRYVPEAGGYIFVRRLASTPHFVVLEGNRRLVAMRQILENAEELQPTPDVLISIRAFDVLEIVDDLPPKELQKKVSYLLGTCHHGSHKNWSPFARAKGIFERYLEISGQRKEGFRYDKQYGAAVASLLSIKADEVEERLSVYCAMSQLASDERMKERPRGGVIDSNYSLVLGAVRTSSKELKKYIPVHPETFRLEKEGIDRIIHLCNFDGTRDRNSPRAPGQPRQPPAMTNPKQWSYLAQILEDESRSAREQNMKLVEESHQPPEEVWSRRHAELTKLTWKKWLEQVFGILQPVSISADLDSQEAIAAMKKLASILNELSQRGPSR